MNTTHYPVPAEDEDNRPMLQAWREGRLVLPACQSCGRTFFYPRPLCPHCWSDTLRWREASGEATVVSFSLVRRPNDPAFFDEAPIVLAELMLAEGVAMLARIVDVAPDAVASGMRVSLVGPPRAARFGLPTFAPPRSLPGEDG